LTLDPVVTNPEHYKVVFENEHVRVAQYQDNSVNGSRWRFGVILVVLAGLVVGAYLGGQGVSACTSTLAPQPGTCETDLRFSPAGAAIGTLVYALALATASHVTAGLYARFRRRSRHLASCRSRR